MITAPISKRISNRTIVETLGSIKYRQRFCKKVLALKPTLASNLELEYNTLFAEYKKRTGLSDKAINARVAEIIADIKEFRKLND